MFFSAQSHTKAKPNCCETTGNVPLFVLCQQVSLGAGFSVAALCCVSCSHKLQNCVISIRNRSELGGSGFCCILKPSYLWCNLLKRCFQPLFWCSFARTAGAVLCMQSVCADTHSPPSEAMWITSQTLTHFFSPSVFPPLPLIPPGSSAFPTLLRGPQPAADYLTAAHGRWSALPLLADHRAYPSALPGLGSRASRSRFPPEVPAGSGSRRGCDRARRPRAARCRPAPFTCWTWRGRWDRAAAAGCTRGELLRASGARWAPRARHGGAPRPCCPAAAASPSRPLFAAGAAHPAVRRARRVRSSRFRVLKEESGSGPACGAPEHPAWGN